MHKWINGSCQCNTLCISWILSVSLQTSTTLALITNIFCQACYNILQLILYTGARMIFLRILSGHVTLLPKTSLSPPGPLTSITPSPALQILSCSPTVHLFSPSVTSSQLVLETVAMQNLFLLLQVNPPSKSFHIMFIVLKTLPILTWLTVFLIFFHFSQSDCSVVFSPALINSAVYFAIYLFISPLNWTLLMFIFYNCISDGAIH